jgi:hypothetical protein
VNVDVRNFLARPGTVVDQDKEIFGVKHLAEAALCLGHAVHQHAPFIGQKVDQTWHATLRDHKGMARAPWKHIKERVPSFTAGHGVRWEVALDDALEQRRTAHAQAWGPMAFNPHADSAGARTQWPETPFRTARVSVVPSAEIRVWCICSASVSG